MYLSMPLRSPAHVEQETVVFIHAWRNHVRELNSLQTRGRRCEYRWLAFELYTFFHSWLRTCEDVKFARGRMVLNDMFK